jgi:hypothetical protein
MASPGPNYNPDISLLQGGNAPIVAVQGGGGMEAGAVPSGYNPEQSLLNTQSHVPIVAVRGGGSQKGGDGEKVYKDYVVEIYEPPLEMIELPPLPDVMARRDLLTKYIKASLPDLKEVQSLERAPTTFSYLDDVAPTYQKCSTETGKRRLPLNFFEIVRKRIVLIDTPNPHVWIVPNLKGNVSRFLQYMKLIPKTPEGAIDPNHVVVFTGSFFALSTPNDNLLLYHLFLTQKLANMKQLFYLNNLNDDFVSTACSIVRSIYSTDYLRSPEGQEKPLTAFFEPDILVFTQPHLVLKNSELPIQRENSAVRLSKILTLPTFPTKSFLIVPSRETYDELPSDDSDEPPEKRYFFFAFHRNVIKQIKTPAKSDLICPEGQTCKGFKGGYKIVSVGDDRKIETPGLYLLRQTTDTAPFFKEAGVAVPPPPPPPVADETVPPPPPPSAAAAAAAEEPAPIKPKEEPFKAGAAESADEQALELNGVEYRIRIPLNKVVVENWKEGIFTENEAKFLNALQMNPRLLSDVFGTKFWKPRLAEFLERIVMSNCFRDPTLLTDTECSTSKDFVKAIYLEMYNRSLKELYDTLGYPKPQQLEDILESLKRLVRAGPSKSSTLTPITKWDYTGDLLDRFQTIYFDKSTGSYYTDFAKLTDETRKLLQELKLVRVEDVDVEEITKAILERLGIPLTSGGGSEDVEVFDMGDEPKRNTTRRSRKQSQNQSRRHARNED